MSWQLLRQARARHAAATALAQAAAWAHGSVPGLGSFASGVLHPLLAPPHALALVALGLLLGQRGLEQHAPHLAGFHAGHGAGPGGGRPGLAA